MVNWRGGWEFLRKEKSPKIFTPETYVGKGWGHFFQDSKDLIAGAIGETIVHFEKKA